MIIYSAIHLVIRSSTIIVRHFKIDVVVAAEWLLCLDECMFLLLLLLCLLRWRNCVILH